MSAKIARSGRATLDKIADYERLYRSGEPKKRPEPLPIESTFDAFVESFGGQKIAERFSDKSRMPKNADYIFPEHNAIVELKTLEGVFSGPTAFTSFQQAFIDCGEPLAAFVRAVMGDGEIPPRVIAKIKKRMRRALEDRVSAARRQLRRSKTMFGDGNTRSLILFAIDSQPLFGHRSMLYQLATLMGSNYADEHVDGVVYMNPNIPTRITPDGMEYSGWYPFYRDDDVNDALSGFVNLLGNRWLTFYGNAIGSTNPVLELETIDDLDVVLDGSYYGE